MKFGKIYASTDFNDRDKARDLDGKVVVISDTYGDIASQPERCVKGILACVLDHRHDKSFLIERPKCDEFFIAEYIREIVS